MNSWKNRIVGQGEVDPKSLLANEYNYRTHSFNQKDVVASGLDEIGWLKPIIINKRDCDGWKDNERGVDVVLDGHLRAMIAMEQGESKVPVVWVNLNPEEERLALLMLDPSSEMAGTDNELMAELIKMVEPMSPTTISFLDDLAKKHKLIFDEMEEDLENEMDGYEDADGDDEDFDEDSIPSKFSFGEYSGLIDARVYEIFKQQFEDGMKSGVFETIGDFLAELLGL